MLYPLFEFKYRGLLINVSNLSIFKRVVYFALVLTIFGCGSDTQEPPAPPAVFQEAIPKNEGNIPANGTILLVFSKRPVNFRTDSPNGFGYADEIEKDKARNFALNNLHFSIRKKSVVILGPFSAPATVFNVYWGDAEPQPSITLRYIVTSPF